MTPASPRPELPRPVTPLAAPPTYLDQPRACPRCEDRCGEDIHGVCLGCGLRRVDA